MSCGKCWYPSGRRTIVRTTRNGCAGPGINPRLNLNGSRHALILVLTKKSVLIETVEFAKPQCVACESHVYPFGLPALLRASLFPTSRGHKLRLSSADRVLWVWLSHLWTEPETSDSFRPAEWTARQLLEAFSWDNAPRYLLRDRDGIYGQQFCDLAKGMGIHEVLTAPQSPWQNAYAERLIGSIRRECLDHVIVFHSAGLRRILNGYFDYYERCRTHLSLEKDAPVSRPAEPPSLGPVIEIPKVGGLHNLYTRKAA